MYFAGALTRGGSNPIIRNALTSGQYDSTKVGPHPVAKVANGDYRMWFEAVKDDASATTTVAYATSTDGTSWTKYGSNPIMSPAGWENDEVSPNTVFYDADDRLWKMWYHGGVVAGVGTRKIGYATSPDGLTWTKSGSNPILSNGGGGTWDANGVVEPMVVKFGPTDYRMWYRAFNASNLQQIGHATSTDGITWTKSGSNPIFAAGASGQWDDGQLNGFTVLYHQGIFHAWYVADDGSASNSGIGYAWSLNGTSWTRGPFNPVITNLGGANIYSPTDILSVYLDGTRARILYGDYDLGASPVKRGVAESYFDGVTEPNGLLVDNFNRPDDPSPPPGTGWTNGVTTFVGGEGLAIISNQMTGGSGAGSYRQGGYYNVRDYGPDVFAIMDVSSYAVTGFPGFTLLARLTTIGASTTDGYGIDYDQATPQMTLVRIDNAGEATLVNLNPYTVAAGDQVALECTGSTIAFWHKASGAIWLRRSSATDTTYTAGGKIGLETQGLDTSDRQAIKLDNLTVGPAPPPGMPTTFAPVPYMSNQRI